MIDFACKNFEIEEIIRCALGLTRADYKVLQHMMKVEEWCQTETLSKQLKLDITTVQRSVKKLHEKGAVMRRQNNLDSGGYIFLYRIKDKNSIRKLLQGIIQKWADKVSGEIEKW